MVNVRRQSHFIFLILIYESPFETLLRDKAAAAAGAKEEEEEEDKCERVPIIYIR